MIPSYGFIIIWAIVLYVFYRLVKVLFFRKKKDDKKNADQKDSNKEDTDSPDDEQG